LLGIAPSAAAEGLGDAEVVPGRFETVSDPARHSISLVVDYAHTPDGLDELLRAARRLVGDGRLIAVFGCAGDRDVEKRAPMGAVGARLADLAIVTSDNPRGEDPGSIVEQVVAGADPADRSKVRAEVDRRSAIGLAIAAARPGDIVVVAGKGHESTQTIGDEARPFDDRVVGRELLAEFAPTDMSGETS
jgi:UDP-N-acetylmuramoyl-L-alanyl-D-glutamate--2,6-diaminopimelate ligase